MKDINYAKVKPWRIGYNVLVNGYPTMNSTAYVNCQKEARQLKKEYANWPKCVRPRVQVVKESTYFKMRGWA